MIVKTGYRSAAVVDGSWDREIDPVDFEGKVVYRSCHAHWIEGLPWEQTEIFRSQLSKIQAGRSRRFNTADQLIERYRRLDEIFERVKMNATLSRKKRDLVMVSITREGKLVWGPNGRHRITISLVLGFDSIPVRTGFIQPAALDRFQRLREKPE